MRILCEFGGEALLLQESFAIFAAEKQDGRGLLRGRFFFRFCDRFCRCTPGGHRESAEAEAKKDQRRCRTAQGMRSWLLGRKSEIILLSPHW